jgi:hypothetical protein
MNFGGTRICEYKVCGVSEGNTIPNEKKEKSSTRKEV